MAICFVLLFMCCVNSLSESYIGMDMSAKAGNTVPDKKVSDENGNKLEEDAYEYYLLALPLLVENNYNDKILVIGHKSPDTDTVCSAIAYANLLKLEGYDAEPRIAGKINSETKYVLESFNTPVPNILETAEGKNVILVDHNDFNQCVDGIQHANVLAVVEHHALSANPITNSPIFVVTMPYGATATVISYLFREYLTTLDKQTAGLLLAAILSDTVNLTSSTTTVYDKTAVEILSGRAGISDTDEYYKKMHKAALSYDGMTDREVIYSDWRDYLVNGFPFSIFSLKSIDTKDSEKMMKLARHYITKNRLDKRGNDIFGMFTDEEKDETWIVPYTSGAEKALRESFADFADGKVRLSGDVSRKLNVYPPLADYYSSRKTENAA